jgi:hypothetical protein
VGVDAACQIGGRVIGRYLFLDFDGVLGSTPARMSSAHCRGAEVGWYLDDHDISPSQIVILEDAYDMRDLSPRTVYTDPEVGLTEADVEKAVRLFEGGCDGH